MAATEQLQRLANRHNEKKSEALKVAVLLLQGVTVDDGEIVAICDRCRMTTGDFSAMVQTLTDRKNAWDTFHVTDWESEIEAATQDAREKSIAYRKVLAEWIDAEKRKDAAYTSMYCAQYTPSSIAERRDRRRREMTNILQVTGATDDWRKIAGFDEADWAEIDASEKATTSVKPSKPSKPAKQTTAA